MKRLTLISLLFLASCAEQEPPKWRIVCVTAGHGIPVQVPDDEAYVHKDGGLNCSAVYP